MADPTYLLDDQAAEVDTLVALDGSGRYKAAGRDIAATGISSATAPTLVEDATKLLGHGSKAVAAGPTRTALAASTTPARRLTVKAWVANTHTLYVGLSTVTADTNATTGGFQLSPGETLTCGIADVHDVYIHGTAAEGASFFFEE